MSKLDDLIDFGREMKTVSSKKGALIQLTKNNALLINDRHSVAFIVKGEFGTGCFYAEEAPKGTKKVRLRGDKTLFATDSSGVKRHIFVPTKQNVNKEVSDTFVKYWGEPNTVIPPKVWTTIDPSILTTSISFHQNQIIVTQQRADGNVEIENLFDLSFGFTSQDILDSSIITIYTSDFLLLSYLKNVEVNIISHDHPLVVRGTLKGMQVRGLIAYHKFEV